MQTTPDPCSTDGQNGKHRNVDGCHEDSHSSSLTNCQKPSVNDDDELNADYTRPTDKNPTWRVKET